MIFAVCMMNYGAKLYLMLQNHAENIEQEEKNLLRTLSIRVVLITVLLSLIFAVRACYNLLYTWGLTLRYFPDSSNSSLNPISWEGIVNTSKNYSYIL